MSKETIKWSSVEDESPDDGCDVVIRTASPSMPVWIGHHDGDDGWRYCDGSKVAYVVTHWADIPEGPSEPSEIKGEATCTQ